MESAGQLNQENFLEMAFRFRDRQAGVSIIYDPNDEVYTYNAYCLELKLQKELYTCEFEFLDDALELINDEFGTWKLEGLGLSQCSTCVK